MPVSKYKIAVYLYLLITIYNKIFAKINVRLAVDMVANWRNAIIIFQFHNDNLLIIILLQKLADFIVFFYIIYAYILRISLGVILPFSGA